MIDKIMELRRWIATRQLDTMLDLCRGEEGQFFIDKLEEIHQRVTTMPKTYEQDGKGMNAIAYLHYFTSGCDWWITERDSEPIQHQAFGYAAMAAFPGCEELGYISIVELIRSHAELDLFFEPTRLCDIPQIKKETA